MKKRILSVLLLCCMVLGLLPTTVSAADGPMDTVPKYDVSIDVYNRTSDITIKDSRSYYIYSSVPDKERDTWTWNWKIFIKGDKAAPHIFIDGVNIERSPSSKGPAIELNKKASAYLYFIGRDSTLQGATGRAAIQKNRSEGQVHVLVRTGTTVTCKGGEKAAVEQAAALAKEAGARRCIPLKVSGPFHTKLMAPAGDALAQRFAGENFGAMETPVLFNCLGHEKAETDSIPQLLVKQVQSSVYMEDTLRRLGELGVDHILEVGPGNALSGFVKKTLPGVVCTAVETPEQLDAVLTAWKEAE
jgi:hypothetical protein